MVDNRSAPGGEEPESLSEDEPPESLSEAPAPLSKREKPLRDLVEARRWNIAVTLIVSTVALTLCVMAVLAFGDDAQAGRIDAARQDLIGPFHTLLALAVGYYFAEKAFRRD